MRSALNRRQIRRDTRLGRAVSTSIPAPIGGWNARDSLGNMSPIDAVTLENFFPATSYIVTRSGYSKWSTGYPGQVQSIFAYSGGTTNKLFGVSNGGIYESTSTGAIGAAKVSGLGNSKFQYINVTTAAGSFLMCVNGSDVLQYFDGTTWTADGGTYSITGVTTSTIAGINLFKNRVWLIPTATLKAWYLPTSSIQGAAANLDLSSFAPHGGYLMAMATWTVDAGYGVDDYAVFITSNGDVIVYRGTDPASSTTWAMVGVWWIGSPIGRRCFVKYAGDILIISQDGVYPLSQALQSDRLNQRLALTDKIQFAVSAAVTNYSANFGWQLLPFPKQNMLFLNVPIAVGIQQQYVMNTITKQWCNFTGWAANCWELYLDDPYFGGNTYIGKAWNTQADAGQNINCYCLQAFSYFRNSGTQKRFTLIRPTFQSDGTPSVKANINTDFNQTDTSSSLTFTSPNYSVWDSAIWDLNTWGQPEAIYNTWQAANGIGYCGAALVKTASSQITVKWISTDVVYEAGAIL